MSTLSTPAILLKRSSYGDYDLIVTFLTLTKGKFTVIAKNAKKSRKRFAGVLEPFYLLNVVYKETRGRGMPVLHEASLDQPFAGIRGNIMKTAFASYWAELVYSWLEDEKEQSKIYYLLKYCLGALDSGVMDVKVLSIIFQIRFLSISGMAPNFSRCTKCNAQTDIITHNRLFFELALGGILCQGCSSGNHKTCLGIGKGTVKQLLWVQENDLKTVERLKFSEPAQSEALSFLEKFTVYHLGREPKSLKFLNELRFKVH